MKNSLPENPNNLNKPNGIFVKNTGIIKRSMHWGWIVKISFAAFFISVLLAYISSAVMNRLDIFAAFLVLLLFILLGIIFDIIGIAVASSDERPFHSMAAKKVRGAKRAIILIRNSQKVSSFCNDVVGDIAGIISGVTIAVIVGYLSTKFKIKDTALLSMGITGGVAAFTIGGKAIGKTIGINNANTIIYFVSLIFSFVLDKKEK